MIGPHDRSLFDIEPEAIPRTRVLATMFDGRIVHVVAFGLGDSRLTEVQDAEYPNRGISGSIE